MYARVLVHAAKADLKSIQLEWNAGSCMLVSTIPNPLTPCMHPFSLILPGCFVPLILLFQLLQPSPVCTCVLQIYRNLDLF
jgi:hypothetical protein